MRSILVAISSIILGAMWAAAAAAQPAGVSDPNSSVARDALATDIHETIDRVRVRLLLPNGRPHESHMIVTHYRPEGHGPFPVVIYHHGRNSQRRAEYGRFRGGPIVRYFTRRGFAVLVPTRVGYGESGQSVDPEASGPCSRSLYPPVMEAMTEQTRAVIQHARTLPWTDTSRIILSGASYGGFAAIAGVAADLPGVVAGINFVGGIGGHPTIRPGAPCSPERIAELIKDLGTRASAPMLWLYSANDTYWGPVLPRDWHDGYNSSGGRAKLAWFGPIGNEGHHLMSAGFRLWRPVMDRYLASLGFDVPRTSVAPSQSSFAEISDTYTVPYLSDKSRTEGYQKFLDADIPRAFAIAPNGAYGWRSGSNAIEMALARCQQRSRARCTLYAVDDHVVYSPEREAADRAARK